jgi:low temperature requirement protein LtrA
MRARDSDEQHRAATPLEPFFDLCFVVAVAQAAGSLHHALVEDHLKQAALGYPMAFVAVTTIGGGAGAARR